MKKLTLDETWRLCLIMWRWIAKEARAGSRDAIWGLKCEWLEKHGYEDVSCNCFFCEYADKRKACCDLCPAYKIDKEFYEFGCQNAEYDWRVKPIAFYNKLCSLNRKRLVRRKK